MRARMVAAALDLPEFDLPAKVISPFVGWELLAARDRGMKLAGKLVHLAGCALYTKASVQFAARSPQDHD